MILHPDYAHIAAVADMDPNKRGKPDMQVKDCQFAVQTLHSLRDRLIADGIGFIGNSQAIVHVYCTHPYRAVAEKLVATNTVAVFRRAARSRGLCRVRQN